MCSRMNLQRGRDENTYITTNRGGNGVVCKRRNVFEQSVIADRASPLSPPLSCLELSTYELICGGSVIPNVNNKTNDEVSRHIAALSCLQFVQ